MPPSLAVAKYKPTLASMRATFVGQQDTSNHGARSPDSARGLSCSSSGTGPADRWWSVFA
jgi:hypothetical protein